MIPERFSVRIHGLGSCWWLERHGSPTYAGMDLCNTTGIRTGRRARQFTVKAGRMFVGVPVLEGFDHQLDVLGVTFSAAFFAHHPRHGCVLRLEEVLVSRPQPEWLLVKTSAQLKALRSHADGLRLVAASSHKEIHEYLWLLHPGVQVMSGNRRYEYTQEREVGVL